MATRTKRAPKKASKATAATKKVQPIPAGYPSITPYLRVRETDRALAFYTKAFGAKAKGRMAGVDGRVMHAEMQVFNTRVMLSDEFPERGTLSPESLKGSPVGLFVYTRDVDGAIARAVAAGATVTMPTDHPRPFRARLAARDPQGGRVAQGNAAAVPDHAGAAEGLGVVFLPGTREAVI